MSVRPNTIILSKQTAWISCLIIGLTWLIYSRACWFDFVDIDDPTYIRDNPTVLGGMKWSSLRWVWTTSYFSNWHPITTTSWLIEIELFGISPGQMHLTNITLHTINAFLVYLLFLRMTGNSQRSSLVALLFAIHPQHVESVVWISSRKDVLFAFFGLLSIHFYVSYAKASRWHWYVLSLFAFAASLLSKQMLVTLPCLLLLMDFYPLRRFSFFSDSTQALQDDTSEARRISIWKSLLEKIPFFILTVLFSLLILSIQSEHGSVSSGEEFPLSNRLTRTVTAFQEYLQHLILPKNLSVFYPFNIDGPEPIEVVTSTGLLLLITVFTLWKLRSHPWLFTGWFWFVGTMIPVIGLIQIGWQRIADRYTYFPMIGLYFAGVWFCAEIIKHLDRVKALLATLCICFLLFCSWHQVGVWRDGITLFEHAARCAPRDAKVRTTYGWALFHRGLFQDASNQFQIAVETEPHNPIAHSSLADFYHRVGKEEKALQHHQIARQLGTDLLKVQYDAGSFYQDVGMFNLAIEC